MQINSTKYRRTFLRRKIQKLLISRRQELGKNSEKYSISYIQFLNKIQTDILSIPINRYNLCIQMSCQSTVPAWTSTKTIYVWLQLLKTNSWNEEILVGMTREGIGPITIGDDRQAHGRRSASFPQLLHRATLDPCFMRLLVLELERGPATYRHLQAEGGRPVFWITGT